MKDLGNVFLAAVERNPHALAIVDDAVRFTYAEWRETVLRITNGLKSIGLQRGNRLCVTLKNRWEMAALHWACQLAGIVVIPVNWRVKGNELDFYLNNSEANALVFESVTAEATASAEQAQSIPRIAVGQVERGTLLFTDLEAHPPAEPYSLAEETDLSLMFYTSGTTGKPKGVPRKHRAEKIAAMAHVAQNQYAYTERTLGVMPFYHTMGVRSLLAMTLINGVFVCLPTFDTGKALRLIQQEKITNLYLVPTLYHSLLEDPNFNSERVVSVRKIGFAGASMTDGLLKRIHEAFQPDLFVNHYGSSEIYTFTVCPSAPDKPGSAGKAGMNQRIRVVRLNAETSSEIANPMEEGQVIADLSSDEAFEGYWKRPDADAKSLREGWYFTGDTGYVDADGDLFVTGRVDDIIITGGENVSPVEIESLLSRHPMVDEVAVAGIADEKWGESVTAFIKRKGIISPQELDAYCKNSDLANFKRPRDYVFVAEIPKSPVGKILRRLLKTGEYQSENSV